MTDVLQKNLAQLQQSLASYLVADEVAQILKAFVYAKKAHEGQMRRSGDPYISHPLAVAQILASLKLDHQCLMAALLHDVVEDTVISYDDLAQEFGTNVADLVNSVTKITNIPFRTKAEEQAENFQKMIVATGDDVRVILIKLADRLHNMRTLGSMPANKAKRIARETLEIYAPIAKKLGLYDIYTELEVLGFHIIHYMRASLIDKAVQKVRKKHQKIINKIKQELTLHLQNSGLSVEIIGREKHSYSIYRKIKEKKISFKDAMGVYTFKVLVDSRDNCYVALGKVHELYKLVPGNIRDHIAIPKINGYQALHTTIFGSDKLNIEIQIRTNEMNEFAHKGISVLNHKALKNNDLQEWSNLIKELHTNSDNASDFLANFKNDLSKTDAIYVFSPQGKIFDLPRDSCAVDFAYKVFSDIGNSCVACRINREPANLTQKLRNSDMVEIITAPYAQPQEEWLDFVKTSRAKSHIQKHIKKQQKISLIALGEILLNMELAKSNTYFEQINMFFIAKALKKNQVGNSNDLFYKIGQEGDKKAKEVADFLIELEKNSK